MNLSPKEADTLRSILKRAAENKLKELVIQIDETDFLTMQVKRVLPGDRQFSFAPQLQANVFAPREKEIKA